MLKRCLHGDSTIAYFERASPKQAPASMVSPLFLLAACKVLVFPTIQE